jgi:hypothetical protein
MRPRFQDPKVLKRSDVARPYYYMQAFVPTVTSSGVIRKRQNFRLGYCNETTLSQAKAEKQRLLAGVNSGSTLIRAQLPF